MRDIIMINIVIPETTIITNDNNEIMIFCFLLGLFSFLPKKICLYLSVAIFNTQYQTYQLLPSCEY